MSQTALRIALFTIYPLVLAWMVLLVDRSVTSRERRLEVVLIFLFAITVAANGIFSFFAHFFISDIVADAIGWPAGNPFQLEVAVANLSIGVLGTLAVGRRDGMREAAVIAAAIFALGASVVHVMDILATGNLAPGNSLQIGGNTARAVVLIWTLAASRKAENSALAQESSAALGQIALPILRVAAPLSITISLAYGAGFASGNLWFMTILGAVVGAGMVLVALARAPGHRLAWDKTTGQKE